MRLDEYVLPISVEKDDTPLADTKKMLNVSGKKRGW
jgi:hypothetical protein